MGYGCWKYGISVSNWNINFLTPVCWTTYAQLCPAVRTSHVLTAGHLTWLLDGGPLTTKFPQVWYELELYLCSLVEQFGGGFAIALLLVALQTESKCGVSAHPQSAETDADESGDTHQWQQHTQTNDNSHTCQTKSFVTDHAMSIYVLSNLVRSDIGKHSEIIARQETYRFLC